MQRIQGQNNSAAAGVPQQGQSTSPYASMGNNPNYSFQGRNFSHTSGQQSSQGQGSPLPQGPSTATPVTGNGKIPDPSSNPQQSYSFGGMQPFYQQRQETFGPPPSNGTNNPYNPQQPSPQNSQQGSATPQPTSAQPPPTAPVNPAPAGPTAPPGWTVGSDGWATNSATGQRVPTNNPIFTQAQQAAGVATGANGQPVNPGASPTNPNGEPTRPGGTNLGGMTLDNSPFSTYNPSQISQYNSPDQAQGTSGENNLMNTISNNPTSMSPDVVNALKEQSNTNALLAAKQSAMQLGSSAAARGLDDSGQVAQLYNNTNNAILANNTGIDTQAAQQNFQDRQQSLAAIDNILNSQTGRAQSNYQTGLAGQTAQANQNYQGYNSNLTAQQLAQQRQISQFGINQAVAGNAQQNYATDAGNYFAGRQADLSDAQLAEQAKLGEGSLGQGQQQINNQASQFGQNYGLNVLQFLQNQANANNQLGYNYAALNQNSQNTNLQSILSMLGL